VGCLDASDSLVQLRRSQPTVILQWVLTELRVIRTKRVNSLKGMLCLLREPSKSRVMSSREKLKKPRTKLCDATKPEGL
jgi:hypothetical protein